MTTALAVLCSVLAVTVVGLAAQLMRTQRRLDASKEATLRLEADLAKALKPPPASNPAERTMRRMVRTVGSLRERGVAGMLQASMDDLMSWAAEERGDILNIAAPDGTVTLMFSDIEDSTALNAKMGDSAWLKVLATHDDIVRGCVAKYRGQVVKTAGDSFMVAFRDAEAACRAALSVQKGLARSRLATVPVKVRIGVHSGQAIAHEGDYFGHNVALAARVAGHASGGEVLATDAVLESLDEDAAVDLYETEEVELKGLPGTHQLYRVERASNGG